MSVMVPMPPISSRGGGAGRGYAFALPKADGFSDLVKYTNYAGTNSNPGNPCLSCTKTDHVSRYDFTTIPVECPLFFVDAQPSNTVKIDRLHFIGPAARVLCEWFHVVLPILLGRHSSFPVSTSNRLSAEFVQ